MLVANILGYNLFLVPIYMFLFMTLKSLKSYTEHIFVSATDATFVLHNSPSLLTCLERKHISRDLQLLKVTIIYIHYSLISFYASSCASFAFISQILTVQHLAAKHLSAVWISVSCKTSCHKCPFLSIYLSVKISFFLQCNFSHNCK